MQDPFRLRVLKALTAALEQITVANGYQFDLTGKVFRGRDAFGDGDPLPLVSILESVDEKSIGGTSAAFRPGKSIQQSEWELLVQGFVVDDRDNPTDPGYRLLADVKKKLAEVRIQKDNILGFGQKVTDFEFSAGVVRPADQVSSKTYFWLKVRMNIVEDHSDPFA